MFQGYSMTNMVLVIDESGAKGYSRQQESTIGEIGVMAGYLYTESEIEQISRMFQQVTSNIKGLKNQKLHIAELSSEQQEDLRNGIFDLIKMSRLQWFYTAIYSQGFHESEFCDNRGTEDSKRSLHNELFAYMLGKAANFARSIGVKDLNLRVLTDNVGKGEKRMFTYTAKEMTRVMQGLEQKIEKTRYNKGTGEKEKYTEVSSIKADFFPMFDSLDINISCEVSALTIAADVLANSTHYYLKNNRSGNLENDLNSKRALSGHPLIETLLAPETVDVTIPFSDIVFRRTSESET